MISKWQWDRYMAKVEALEAHTTLQWKMINFLLGLKDDDFDTLKNLAEKVGICVKCFTPTPLSTPYGERVQLERAIRNKIKKKWGKNE